MYPHNGTDAPWSCPSPRIADMRPGTIPYHGPLTGFQRRSGTVRVSAGGRAEDRVDALLSSAPIGLAFFDAELRFERTNQPFLELLDTPGPEIEGQPVDDVPGMPPKLARAIRRAFESGVPADEMEVIVSEHGPIRAP